MALTPAEITEMRGHLLFLRRYKEILRLKLNASEDLLVNGQREPTDRGVCQHLLGKVDRSVVERALEREPLRSDAATRAEMLAGAVRLTADVSVLLAYLDALSRARSRAEGAAAFAEVVRRIDFGALAPSRMAKLLEVLVYTFADHERTQVLLGLLDADAFQRAYDAAGPHLLPEVTAICAPVRAVHRRIFFRTGDVSGEIVAGVGEVLRAPDPILRGYGEPLRVGLLTLALDPRLPVALADRAAGILLPTLAHDAKTYAPVAPRRGGQLQAAPFDYRARATLAELRRQQPEHRTAERWLAALDAHRLSRIALTGGDGSAGRFTAGFWLDGQRAVWVRTATVAEAERLASEAQLQRELVLAGIAPVVEHGVALGSPYIAVAGRGRPLVLSDNAPLPLSTGLSLGAAAARVFFSLATAQVALPDAAAERFLYSGAGDGLTLADLNGAVRMNAAPLAAHAALVGELVRRLVPAAVAARLGASLAGELERALAGDLVRLISACERLALLARD